MMTRECSSFWMWFQIHLWQLACWRLKYCKEERVQKQFEQKVKYCFWCFDFVREKKFKLFTFVKWWFNNSRRWAWCVTHNIKRCLRLNKYLSVIIKRYISSHFHCWVKSLYLISQHLQIYSLQCLALHLCSVPRHNCLNYFISRWGVVLCFLGFFFLKELQCPEYYYMLNRKWQITKLSIK